MFEIKLEFDERGLERAMGEAVRESVESSVRNAVTSVVCAVHGDGKPADLRVEFKGGQMSFNVDWCCPDGEQRIIDAITEELTKE